MRHNDLMSEPTASDSRGFDEARSEWQFEKTRDEHRHCCIGALEWGNGYWVNILAPESFNMRRWDEDLASYRARISQGESAE